MNAGNEDPGCDAAEKAYQVAECTWVRVVAGALNQLYQLICRCFGDTGPKPSMSRMLIRAAMPDVHEMFLQMKDHV
jgi:hypothetical protein